MVVSNIWLLFLFCCQVALTLVNASQTIPNTGLGRNCGNDFCSVLFIPWCWVLWRSDKNLRWHVKEMIRRGRCTPMRFLILFMRLAVYGLVTFNYGKFGSELFMEVISILVDYHIINLTFAIFCAAVVDLSLKWAFYCWWSYGCEVDDSYQNEESVIFQSRFHSIRIYHCICRKKELSNLRHVITMQGKGHVVRVLGWPMVGATAFNFQKFLEAISANLSVHLTFLLITIFRRKRPWMTTWDDLFENFDQRFQNMWTSCFGSMTK